MDLETLFLDIGGVLLTNGWDHRSRQKAAETFGFDYEEYESRHNLVYFVHELGHMSLDQYLQFTIFHEPRPFSLEEFKAFMQEQSQLLPDMLPYLKEMKNDFGIRMVAVSNEGQELTRHRIHHCGLRSLIDIFVVSGFVQYRKPDANIFRLALDLCQTPREKVMYLDDRAALVEAGEAFGIKSIHHRSFLDTKKELESALHANRIHK